MKISLFNDSSDSTVTVLSHNCHYHNHLFYIGLQYFGDSCDRTFNSLAKNKNPVCSKQTRIQSTKIIKRIYKPKVLSLLSLRWFKHLFYKDFLDDS